MRVGLFFGSFNPVHVGHLIIADHMVTQTDLDQVWMVVSPHNPLKKKSTLARDYDRLDLVDKAIGSYDKIVSCNIEFNLPKPSYTVDTLAYLVEKYPELEFVLIMGGDNLQTLHKWKNYEIIVRDYDIYLYRRPAYDTTDSEKKYTNRLKIFEAPLMEISSTLIRERLKNRQSIKFLVPSAVEKEIMRLGMYQYP